MNPSTEPILDAANKFLWSDEMQESMDGFASNYGEMFVGVTRQQAAGRAEQKLEWTEAHNEFSQLFEFHLEQFLETQPFSTEDFVAACQDGARQGHPLASCENCPSRSQRRSQLSLSWLQPANRARALPRSAGPRHLGQLRADGAGRALDDRVRQLCQPDGGQGGGAGARGGRCGVSLRVR